MHGRKPKPVPRQPRLGARLRALQERYADPALTLATVLLLLLFFAVLPLEALGVRGFGMVAAMLVFGIVVAAAVISGSALVLGVMLLATALNAGAMALRLIDHPAHLHLAAGAWFVFSLALGAVVARAVFGPGPVNYHRIVGAILLYLLFATAFMALYAFAALGLPDAFAGLKTDKPPAIAAQLVYFSFTTLTTTGYGDIAPAHPLVRSLANLEMIVGQLYPATLLARLVTLEIESRKR